MSYNQFVLLAYFQIQYFWILRRNIWNRKIHLKSLLSSINGNPGKIVDVLKMLSKGEIEKGFVSYYASFLEATIKTGFISYLI